MTHTHTHTDRHTHTHTYAYTPMHSCTPTHSTHLHPLHVMCCSLADAMPCMHGTCSFARNPCPDVMSVHAENLSHVLTAHGSLLVLRCHVNFGMISQEMKIQTCCRQTDTTLIFFCAAVCVCLCEYLHVCCACCDYRV